MPLQILLHQIQEALNHKQFEQALQLAESGTVAYPEADALYFLAAFACTPLELPEKALAYQQHAIKLAPDNAIYHFNAAVYANNLGGKEMELRGMLHYQRALRIDPNYADALWNYGENLRLNGHIHLAIDCFNRLIALNKIYPKLYNRLAACYESINDREKTDALYEQLLQDKTDVIAAWGYATEQLRRENFAVGWEYYNKRFECSWLNNAYHYPFALPFWDGQMHPNMTLLLHGEQGLGDEMMFASTFNELLQEAKAVKAKVIIGCKAPVARLFQTSFPDAEVYIHSYDRPMDISSLTIDAHLPMGNLLARYRKSHADYKAHQAPYLFAAPQRSNDYAQSIKQLGRESVDGKRRFRVGLMWSTVANETVSRFVLSASRRSISAELLAPLADLVDDVEFISLQNAECGSQAALIPQLEIVDFSLDQADFYDTAALMQNLDLVITIDTSVFHLAAAMGIETWVALIEHPEWRFGQQERTESYWYGNTRYFRQSKKDCWSDVIDHIRDALAKRIRNKPSQ